MVTGISPDNEAFLARVVATGQFPTREAALDEAVRLLRQQPSQPPATPATPKSAAEWIRSLEEWSDSHPRVSHFVDDSRDSIYEGCGE